jgi:hypothetical protein
MPIQRKKIPVASVLATSSASLRSAVSASFGVTIRFAR